MTLCPSLRVRALIHVGKNCSGRDEEVSNTVCVISQARVLMRLAKAGRPLLFNEVVKQSSALKHATGTLISLPSQH